MANITLEEICWKIINILNTNMAARLAVVSAEYTTPKDLTLENVSRYYFGDAEPEAQNMPAVLVIGRGYGVERAIEQSGNIGVSKQFRDTDRIEIECWITQDPNLIMTVDSQEYRFEEILQIKIMRYARAIRELLLVNETLGSQCVSLNITDMTVSDAIPDENVFLKACRMTLEVVHITEDIV